MKKLVLLYGVFTLFFILNISCSSSEPKTEVASEEKTNLEHSDPVDENYVAPPADFRITAFDGTIENARVRIKEITNAIDSLSISAYSYIYDNGSGENPQQATMYFSYIPQKENSEKTWSLQLRNDYYYLEYFFDENNKLFAIRQYPKAKEIKLNAEIFYNKEGGIMKGSWIQRVNDDVIQLVNYKGDYWYDFLEGYPYYNSVEQMKNDKSLQYQQ